MCAESGKDARAATGVNHDEARDGAAEDRSSTDRRIKALLAAAPFGAHVYEVRKDESLVFLGGNPAADRILGVDNSQFVGKTIEAAFPALTQTEIPQAYRRVALTGEPYETEQCAYDENGIQGVFDLHAFQIGSRRMAVFFQDITERKKADEDLRKSEEKFAQAFLLSPDAVNINRLSDGVYLDINHGFTAAMGYTREEVLGRSSVPGDLGIWVKAEDRARLLEDLKQYGEVSGMVVPFRRKDGSIIIGMMSAKVIEVEGETCILSVTRDVTERTKAEDALRESEERFRNLSSIATEGIMIHEGGVILDANEAFAKMVGVDDPAELIGKQGLEVTPFTQASRQAMAEHLPKKAMESLDVEIMGRDGRVTLAETSSRGVMYQGREARLVRMQDVTERKRAEEQLLREKDFSERLLDSLPGIFYLYGADLRLRRWNRNHESVTGFSAEELSGMSIADWHADEAVKAAAIAGIRETLASGKLGMIEASLLHKDGRQVPYILTSARLDTPEGPMMMGVGIDITERRQAEEALRLDDSRLEALLELSQMTKASMQELAAFAMEEAVRLTGSTVGYVAFVTEDESTLTMYAWSRQAMAECAVQGKPVVYPVESTGLWGEAVRQRRPIITNDYSAPNPWKKGVPEGHVRVDRHMNVPIFDEGRIVVVAGVGNKPTDYDESDVRQLTLLMDGMWRIIRRNRAEEELRRSELDKRQFYRDTIRSVTDGKLDITGYEELASYTGNSADVAEFSSVAELSDVRMQVTEFCLAAGMREDSTGLFLTAVGEALTNAVKHAGKGKSFRGIENDQVWVAVSDTGPGIAALSLPDVTLRRGYSTKASMGLGYSIMLDVCDRIMLSTGTEGTTVVLFRNVEESRPMLSLEGLPDTWDA